MYNTGNKIVICQLQNAISNFPKFCKVCARQKSKKNLAHLYMSLVESFALILNSKTVFKYLLWLKLLILKNTLHALNPLFTHTKKQAYSF